MCGNHQENCGNGQGKGQGKGKQHGCCRRHGKMRKEGGASCGGHAHDAAPPPAVRP